MADKPDFRQPEAPARPGLKDRARLGYLAIRANPTGRYALRIVIGLLGGLVVLAGLVLIPLPGPGWLIVFAGLGIWAIEFAWARNLLVFGRGKLSGWTGWVKRQPLALRLLIGLAGLLFVAAIVMISLRLTFGPGVFQRLWDWFLTH
ncbi:TIGR02611 family protein [Catellatospora sp. TT07R-123]|uniref:TIGR02611 family protein n=1 Tax=Catellatospora sp. TT07R-123 TaxID=2733863 RepID=UPI001FD37C96|nr:TIGR02611 family protein [Catellatospora sp. TT07R-123]